MKLPAVSVFILLSLLAAPFAVAEKTAPKPLQPLTASYPESLTDTGISGQAEVDFVVKADGTVQDVELATASHRAFGKAALAAIRSAKFQAGTVDGTPADLHVSLPFVFNAPVEQQVNAFAKRKVFLNLTSTPLAQQEFGAKLKAKKAPTPMYPRVRGDHEDVKVDVKFVVAPDGSTLNPTIVGKTPRQEFVNAAYVAIALAQYEPPMKNGQAVYVETTTTLKFIDERGEFGGPGGMRGGGGGMGGGMRGGGGMGGMGGGGMGGEMGGGGPN